MIQKGHIGFLAHVAGSAKIKTLDLKDILVIQNFLVEFSDELWGLTLEKEIDLNIALGTTQISKAYIKWV